MPEAIPCPGCGAPMNLHAEKLVHSANEDAATDAGLEGLVFSFHECPRCGRIEQRAEGTL